MEFSREDEKLLHPWKQVTREFLTIKNIIGRASLGYKDVDNTSVGNNIDQNELI